MNAGSGVVHQASRLTSILEGPSITTRSILLADGVLGRSQTFVLMSTPPNDVLSLVCHRLLHEFSFPEYFLHFRVGSNLVVSKNVRILRPLRGTTGDLPGLLARRRNRDVSERHPSHVGYQVARGARCKMLVEEPERTSLPPESDVMHLIIEIR